MILLCRGQHATLHIRIYTWLYRTLQWQIITFIVRLSHCGVSGLHTNGQLLVFDFHKEKSFSFPKIIVKGELLMRNNDLQLSRSNGDWVPKNIILWYLSLHGFNWCWIVLSRNWSPFPTRDSLAVFHSKLDGNVLCKAIIVSELTQIIPARNITNEILHRAGINIRTKGPTQR